VVNFDTHGEPYDAPNKTHSYEKGRGAASDEGVLEAAFDGNHGWFWRNRGEENGPSACAPAATIRASSA
jgi:hypothetical protein